MAVVLGGVTLPPNIVWEDKYKWNPVVQEVKSTLGGSLIVYSGQMRGRRITLVAYQDQGWLTLAQVDAVKALADVAGATYTLTIGAESFTVVFRHEEPPAVEFEPLIPRAVPESGDFFVGRIKLLVV